MSVEAFLKVIDRLPDALLLVSGEGVVLGANRRCARLGIVPSRLLGKPLSDATAQPPEDVAAYLRRCSKTSEPLPGSLTLRRDGGVDLPCRSDGNILIPPSAESQAVVILRLESKGTSAGQFLALNRKIDQLGEEIIRRNRVEEELREQKEWLGVTLSSIGDAVIATDTEGRIIFMNAVAESLTGWRQGEAAGRPLEEVFRIINEETRETVENPVAKCLRGGIVVGLANHTLLIARDGAEYAIDDTAAPIREAGGQVKGVVLIFHDVTEKRKAVEQLRESEERFRTLADSISQLAWMARPDGHIYWYNRRWYEYTGTTPEQMEGWGWQSVHDPDELPHILERWKASLRSGDPFDMVFPLRGADGVLRPFLTRVMPTRDRKGRILLWCGTNTDITEQRRMEGQLRENDRRKDEFLAMLAHELRNPLASINTAVQLFGRLETEEDLLWAKDVVQRQVKHLARLIDDLLDVSRISRGKIGLRKEPLSLSPVVGSAVEAVRPLMEERKHELSVSLINGGLDLEADPLRLEQILVNLLTNAAKYTDAGGRVSLTAKHEGKDIVIQVRDTGMGISAELMPRIFDIFAQGDRTTARSEGGLGIGLTLVQKLAEMHGGTVTAASDGPGKGSEFIVRLPALEGPATREARPRETLPRVARQSSRVLVVDDNMDTAKGLARLLKLLGHDVRVAYDGPTALEAARSHLPEIVLLDIGLPGMDGYEVVKRLRTEECCRDSLIIAASGYGQPEDRRRSKEAGFDHHLVKPVDYNALMSLFAPQTT